MCTEKGLAKDILKAKFGGSTSRISYQHMKIRFWLNGSVKPVRLVNSIHIFKCIDTFSIVG